MYNENGAKRAEKIGVLTPELEGKARRVRLILPVPHPTCWRSPLWPRLYTAMRCTKIVAWSHGACGVCGLPRVLCLCVCFAAAAVPLPRF